MHDNKHQDSKDAGGDPVHDDPAGAEARGTGSDVSQSRPESNAPDGQMDDQDMPTTDGQMASNTSEAVIPPVADPPATR